MESHREIVGSVQSSKFKVQSSKFERSGVLNFELVTLNSP
jgi:hypothetical protein